MTTYFKLVNHSELEHFWQERLLAYYDPQPMTTLHYPRKQQVIQEGSEIALFQYISPTAQVVTHLVHVTSQLSRTTSTDYPWKSDVQVIKQLDPRFFGGSVPRTLPGWPLNTGGQPHGAAGGAPQIWPGHGAGAVRLGHLLGTGDTTIKGIRSGLVLGKWGSAAITPHALQSMIVNNQAYV